MKNPIDCCRFSNEIAKRWKTSLLEINESFHSISMEIFANHLRLSIVDSIVEFRMSNETFLLHRETVGSEEIYQ